MRSFAIDEPGSLVRALYATLLDTTNISEHLIILLNVSDRYRKLTTLKHFYTLYKLCCKGWCLHMRMCKGHSKRQSQRRKFLTPKISNNQGLHPSESVLIIFKRVLPLLLCPRTLWWPGMFPRRFKVKYFQWATLCVFQLRQKFQLWLTTTRPTKRRGQTKRFQLTTWRSFFCHLISFICRSAHGGGAGVVGEVDHVENPGSIIFLEQLGNRQRRRGLKKHFSCINICFTRELSLSDWCHLLQKGANSAGGEGRTWSWS